MPISAGTVFPDLQTFANQAAFLDEYGMPKLEDGERWMSLKNDSSAGLDR
jgi:hypothetical protein